MNFHFRKEDFVPVSSPVLDGHYRTILFIEGDQYRLIIGEGSSRFYTDETLPDEVKTALGMVKAVSGQIRDLDDINVINAYINYNSPEFDTIGWRVHPQMYVLILSRNFLAKEAMHGADA